MEMFFLASSRMLRAMPPLFLTSSIGWVLSPVSSLRRSSSVIIFYDRGGLRAYGRNVYCSICMIFDNDFGRFFLSFVFGGKTDHCGYNVTTSPLTRILFWRSSLLRMCICDELGTRWLTLVPFFFLFFLRWNIRRYFIVIAGNV